MNTRKHTLVSVLAWIGYAFLLFPSLIIIPMSFGGRDAFRFPPRTISLELYRNLINDPAWIQSATQSLWVASICTIVSLLLGTAAALGLSRRDFIGRRPLESVFLSPMFVPGVIVGLALYLYFAQLSLTGTTISLVIAHILVASPFVVLTVSSGIRNINQDLEVASTVMGASPIYTLRRVTIPLLLASIVVGGLFAFLISFDEIVITHFLANTRIQTLPVKMYNDVQWLVSPILAAVSTLLILASVIVCVVAAKLQGTE